jgi:membrane protease YdiL (CAAX protease family)
VETGLSGWTAPESFGGSGVQDPAGRPAPGRRLLRTEILLVIGVSLGYSAISAMIDFVGLLTAHKSLSQQTASLNTSQAPGRPWLDLAIQLTQIGFALVPVLLAVHLLGRDGDAPRILGLRPRRPVADLAIGAGLAAGIGVPGLGLYLAARALGVNATVVPDALPKVWWAIPVLLLSAAQNGLLEELIVVGYLVTRLRQLGWALPAVVLTSALLRGSYHLYQGVGGFFGNAIMGVIFALFFIRYRRVLPLAVAHFLIDSVAFVGYATLHNHLPFLH